MDPISNSDRLLALLRQRLQERAKSQGKRPTTPSHMESGRSPGGLEAVQALATTESVDDRQIKRALVQSILADQFGSKVLNAAPFQQVIDRVAITLDSEPSTRQLLEVLIAELRKSK